MSSPPKPQVIDSTRRMVYLGVIKSRDVPGYRLPWAITWGGEKHGEEQSILTVVSNAGDQGAVTMSKTQYDDISSNTVLIPLKMFDARDREQLVGIAMATPVRLRNDRPTNCREWAVRVLRKAVAEKLLHKDIVEQRIDLAMDIGR